MRIASIESFVRDPMVAVVRVRTDDGAEGWGQTSPYNANLTAAVLHELVAPRFIGRDPWDWEALVDRWRRETAQEMLGDPAQRICAVARRLGYSEPAHFVRAFRRWTGTTPTAWRKGVAEGQAGAD